MLSQADAELVRSDPEIPGLRLLLDPIAFARKVKELWPQLDLKKIEPTQVHYRRGEHCIASFRLSTGQSTIRIYAKAHGGDAGLKLLEARAGHFAAGDEGMTARILSDFGVVIYAFPNDQRLLNLGRLWDPDHQYDLLRALFPSEPAWWHGTIEPLHYRPEHTLVASLSVDGIPRAVIRLLTEEAYTAVRERHSPLPEQDAFRAPRRLGHCDEFRALGYDFLPGARLNKLLEKQGKYGEKGVERAASVLRALHGQSLAELGDLPIVDRATEVERVQNRVRRLTELSPFLRAGATQLAELITDQLERLPETRTLTHGNFGDRQLLLGNHHTALLDMDHLYIGDAHADLGRFVAHLERMVLRGRLDAVTAADYRHRFLEHYGEVAEGRVELYGAIALLDLAANPFTYREAEWLHQIDAMLKRARRILVEVEQQAPEALAF